MQTEQLMFIIFILVVVSTFIQEYYGFSLTSMMVSSIQCWASYFIKVTSYILHITCS